MSDIEKGKRVYPGYQPLANVLQAALDQAQAGKGNQRHANGKPFLEQPIITDGRACGLAGPAFQARKKILEALNCPDEERAVQDLLGAIVYTAAMVILKREEPDHGAELGGASISEQTETSAQAKDTARDAMATSIRYTVPPPQDGDDDPAVHIVPDKTSRSTLPSGCLGRLCGRGDDDEWRPCSND